MKRAIRILTEIFSVMVVISVFGSCSKPTKACFTYNPETITTGTAVNFDGNCSEMTSFFEWNFGDGTPDTATNESQVSHTYTVPGTYVVTLTAIRKDKVGFVGDGEPVQTQTIVVQ